MLMVLLLKNGRHWGKNHYYDLIYVAMLPPSGNKEDNTNMLQ